MGRWIASERRAGLSGRGEPDARRRVGARLRRVALTGSAPAGAATAQFTQALGSFALHVVVARELGAAGLGVFSLLFGLVIVATALSTGLVGDSLTVLDRADPRVRGALTDLTAVIVTVAGTAALVGVWVSGLGVGTAAAFALALVLYLLEDLVRRLTMANLRFWTVALIDGVFFVGAALALLVLAQAEPLALTDFLLALAVGQGAGLVVGLTLQPHNELSGGDWRHPNLRGVLGFGAWRAAQQLVRPSMLTAGRFIVLAAAGTIALGELEAARVYLAPAALLVQGVGSFLLASYARERDAGSGALLQRADRATGALLVASVLVGVTATLMTPVLGDLITRGAFDLSLVAVLGWAVYSASIATVMPYASLAAVIGRQSRVVLLRVMDSTLSLAALAVTLVLLDASAAWSPWCLAAGSFAGGALARQLIVARQARREHEAGTDR